VRLQKEEVAKKLAMKTNKVKTDENEEETNQESSSCSEGEVFKVGDFVRSTFAEDGVDYEAEVLSVNENDTCKIRYIGYGNEERVKMEELVASWGVEAREEQRILAEADQQGTSSNENHQEQLHEFVMTKSQGCKNSLPVPPMVSSQENSSSYLFYSSTHSPRCPLAYLKAAKTRNLCPQC
jgi:Survival motor neuron protein (SMN)